MWLSQLGGSGGWAPTADRPVHLLTPSVLHSDVAKGGTSYYRAVARACGRVGPTTCHELAHPGQPGTAWSTPGAEIRSWDTTEDLLSGLRHLLSPDAVIVKFVGALGVHDWRADFAVGAMARESGAAAVYVDPDAPSRLPLLVGRTSHLADALTGYAAVILFAGGVRAAQEYTTLTSLRTHHASPALTVLGLCEQGQSSTDGSDPEYDLLIPVAAYSARETRIMAALERRGGDRSPRVALVGNWPPGAAHLPGVVILPPMDPVALQTLYSRSRFTFNPLRSDFAGYSDTAAARIFEAAVSGSCIISEWFPGLPNYFEPELECLIATGERLLSALCVEEGDRAAMAQRARERVLADAQATDRGLRRILAEL